MAAMEWCDYERLKQYVGFDQTATAALRELHPSARRSFGEIVADFYEAIRTDDVTRQLLVGGDEQIERLKRTLLRWLDSTLLGPHDAAYFETRARIGHVHVRIELPLMYMVAAMNRIRHRLTEVAHALEDPEQRRVSVRAVNQVLDLELAIMLDTYRAHMDERLRSRERLATIGQLAASIGHELRNPLGIIESSAYLLQQTVAPEADPMVVKHVRKIADQVRVCNFTITELLELARNQPPRKRLVDVRALLASVFDAALLENPSRIIRQAPEGLEANVDPDQMRQVLVNLVHNAEQAQGPDRRIWLEAEEAESGVILRVRDEGPGVPAAARERIFDVLYTTKARGTGLGLALCRRIIEAHGGDMSLEDTDDGASFRILLPH